MTSVNNATLLHPFSAADHLQYGCTLALAGGGDMRLLAVVLQLEVRVVSDPPELDDTGSASQKPEVGPWTMVIAFEEDTFIGWGSPSNFRLLGARLLVEINSKPSDYGVCHHSYDYGDHETHYEWNDGYGTGTEAYIVSGFENRICRGYQCSRSQMVFKESGTGEPEVFTVFHRLNTQMVRTGDFLESPHDP